MNWCPQGQTKVRLKEKKLVWCLQISKGPALFTVNTPCRHSLVGYK